MTARGNLRALVVDDEPQVRALTVRALSSEGFSCDAAVDGRDAEQRLTQQDYDVVVTDLRMPNVHGHKLAVEILKHSDSPLVFVLTAVAEPKLAQDLFERGIEDIFLKPVTYSHMATKIRVVAERRKRALETVTAQPSGAESAGGSRNEVKRQIVEATSTLRSQLGAVTESFKATISDLERQQKALEDGFLGSVRMLSNLINQVTQYGGSHAARVENLSTKLGEAAGLDHNQLRELRIAALLHDIGQFGMPDAIRNKPPSRLSPDESSVYRNYPIIGGALLSEVPGADNIVELIETHAENYDGSGFPYGLKGTEVPLGARIIRLADGCDNFMMHHRDENDPWANTRRHVKSNEGVLYDPVLAGYALKYLKEMEAEADDEEVEEVAARDLAIGQVLAQHVHDDDGRFLARKGAVLTASMLPRIQRLAISQTVRVFRPPKEVNEDGGDENPEEGEQAQEKYGVPESPSGTP